jgi:glycyl-tRNA synthetase
MSQPAVSVTRMEKIVSLCKRRGFIFQSSEIYGGINGFWDYGPLGAELKRNVKELWWRSMTMLRDDVVGLDASIIMHPQIWKASGHVDTFADMMSECPLTKKRVRSDQVDPVTGIAYFYTGAAGEDGARSEDAFSVLIAIGKPPESARKVATQYYESRGVKSPALEGERSEKLEGTVLYHPESGCRLTEPRPFNLMLQTYVGPIQSEENVAYLRPETAQAIFVQFKNVVDTSRQKVPFGIAQIGKAFRNEVTPRNYIFRSREFEQMELEFFIKPDEAVEAQFGAVGKVEGDGHPGVPQPSWGWELWHKYWVEERIAFYEGIGLPRTSLEEYWQTADELAHYAKATVDILFKFAFGTQELEGIAARSDYDLSQHQRFSGKSQVVFDEELRTAWAALSSDKQAELRQRYYDFRLAYLLKAGEAEAGATKQAGADADGLAKGMYIPHVIEPSAGVDRLLLALLTHAYDEETVTDEKGKEETRVVLRFHPRVAPIKVGVFPLLKNKPELVKKAVEVREMLRPFMNVFYDDAGAIGRRYRRQDEAGTPFGITIDFDTIGENGPELEGTVTLRHRDSMEQERVKISELLGLLLPQIQ